MVILKRFFICQITFFKPSRVPRTQKRTVNLEWNIWRTVSISLYNQCQLYQKAIHKMQLRFHKLWLQQRKLYWTLSLVHYKHLHNHHLIQKYCSTVHINDFYWDPKQSGFTGNFLGRVSGSQTGTRISNVSEIFICSVTIVTVYFFVFKNINCF